MHEDRLKVYYKKRKKYSSYMREITPVVPNLLQRNFHAECPNRKWLTDITEFSIPAGKIYLSPIIDCYDGMAVSWSIGESPSAELVNSMPDRARVILKKEEHPVIHSDRGGSLQMAGMDQQNGRIRSAKIYVKERMLSGQRSVRGILWET